MTSSHFCRIGKYNFKNNYTDVLAISTPGMNDRAVALSASSDLGAGIIQTQDRRVYANGTEIHVNGYTGCQLTIYSITGAKIAERTNFIRNGNCQDGYKRLYMVVVDNGMLRTTEKVIVK
jgi:hypothetical protein